MGGDQSNFPGKGSTNDKADLNNRTKRIDRDTAGIKKETLLQFIEPNGTCVRTNLIESPLNSVSNYCLKTQEGPVDPEGGFVRKSRERTLLCRIPE